MTLFPDYSETLDGPSMDKYKKIPEGGTTIAALRATPAAKASIEFGRTLRIEEATAASFLQDAVRGSGDKRSVCPSEFRRATCSLRRWRS